MLCRAFTRTWPSSTHAPTSRLNSAPLLQFFEARSYVCGFTATESDLKVFKAFSAAPNAEKYPNLARFYKHIDAVKADVEGTCPLCAVLTVGGACCGGAAAAAPAGKAKAAAADSDDSDDDLFGDSDDEGDAKAKAKAAAAAKAKAKAAAAAKAKKDKPKRVDKTQVVWEVKPMDSETDLGEIEKKIREIQMDGLNWGEQFARVDVAFGIQKLVVQAVIEDDKVDLADVEEPIEAMEDLVQSIDLSTMNKL